MDQLYFLRHHLQLVRSRGALELLDYAAAMDWAAEQEDRARRAGGATGSRDGERRALLTSALAELAPTMILSAKAMGALEAALDSAGEAPARLPIFGDDEALEVLPAAIDVAPRFEVLCPHCEHAIPRGRLDCAACGRSIVVRAEPLPDPSSRTGRGATGAVASDE